MPALPVLFINEREISFKLNNKIKKIRIMAKSTNNVVTHGLRGKVGDILVFRYVNGDTIVSKVPEKRKTTSEAQIEHNKRFQQASIYAKLATATPETKELYADEAQKRKGMTAYSVAVADFFNAPDIKTIDLSEYTGAAGEEIRVIASDDFAVKSVRVQIINADGSPVEEGEAVKISENLWIYTTSENNERLDGYKISVSASDLPGNVTTEEKSI
jgi:hypothetical protein